MFLLSLLPQQTSVDWRVGVYQCALQSENEMERLSAVKGLPLLIHQLGTKPYNLLHTTLTYIHILLSLSLCLSIFLNCK